MSNDDGLSFASEGSYEEVVFWSAKLTASTPNVITLADDETLNLRTLSLGVLSDPSSSTGRTLVFARSLEEPADDHTHDPSESAVASMHARRGPSAPKAVVAVLVPGVSETVVVDLNFMEKMELSVEGPNEVHAVGSVIVEYQEEDHGFGEELGEDGMPLIREYVDSSSGSESDDEDESMGGVETGRIEELPSSSSESSEEEKEDDKAKAKEAKDAKPVKGGKPSAQTPAKRPAPGPEAPKEAEGSAKKKGQQTPGQTPGKTPGKQKHGGGKEHGHGQAGGSATKPGAGSSGAGHSAKKRKK